MCPRYWCVCVCSSEQQAGACAGRSVSLALPNSLHVFFFSSLSVSLSLFISLRRLVSLYISTKKLLLVSSSGPSASTQNDRVGTTSAIISIPPLQRVSVLIPSPYFVSVPFFFRLHYSRNISFPKTQCALRFDFAGLLKLNYLHTHTCVCVLKKKEASSCRLKMFRLVENPVALSISVDIVCMGLASGFFLANLNHNRRS
jgi:hypothetical protein